MIGPRSKFKGVCRTSPCPVCEGIDGCSVGNDGLILCRRREGAQYGFINLGKSKDDAQWSLYRREGDTQLQRNGHPRRNSSHGQPTPGENWRTRAEQYVREFTPSRAGELAEALGLPVTVFSEVPLIGFCANGPHKTNGISLGPCWTFPEEDGAGNVIGLTCRYRGGEKKAWPGGQRGLTVPLQWREHAGPILSPEGPSDTLGLTALGLSAIGRPSNMGGVDQLFEALHDASPEHRIILLGEFDPKPTGDWPGRDGAVQVATALSQRLGRGALWAMPPDGAKDARAWCQAQRLPSEGEAIGDDWLNAGEKFLAALKPRDALPTSNSSAQPAEPAYCCELIESSTFAMGDYRPQWLVKKLLVRNQPGVIGGPRKCLKTSLLVDLAVSLATGTSFLGEFSVSRPVRVALLSGESGEWTLQETARRVCAARGIDFGGIGDQLCWGFRLPQLARADQLAALQAAIVEHKIEVLLFDPLYLALLAGQFDLEASNLFHIGPLLLAVGRACLDVGCTPLLVHHTKKFTSKNLEPLDLDDLAYAGISEFARQWILVGRAETFEPGTGEHVLWLSAGGSVGHSGLWQVTVSEGQLGDDFSGRKWETKVAHAAEARSQKSATEVEQKRVTKATEQEADAHKVLHAHGVIDPDNVGISYTRLRDSTGLSGPRYGTAVTWLIEHGKMTERVGTATAGNGAEKPAKVLRRRQESML